MSEVSKTPTVTTEEIFSRLDAVEDLPLELIMNARVLVCGAGALGNEVIKCLSLSGVGELFLVDFDIVEPSNLTRSVLFREEDGRINRSKVEAAKRTALEINHNPNKKIHTYMGNIADLGRGIYQRMDLILCTTDSRASRILVNRIAMETGSLWVDGGFQFLNPWGGAVTVYNAADLQQPCYTCSMTSQRVMETLDEAKGLSCARMGRARENAGFLPSTPTIASIIGGMQVQEGFKAMAAIKQGNIDPETSMMGQQLLVDSREHSFRKVQKQLRPQHCYEHQSPVRISDVQQFPEWSSSMTVGALVEGLKSHLETDNVRIAMPFPIVFRRQCLDCRNEDWVDPCMSAYTFTYKARKGFFTCNSCGSHDMVPAGSFDEIDSDERLYTWSRDKTLADVGFRPLDILRVLYYNPEPKSAWIELTGDEASVFGLSSTETEG